ncbi:MAG: ATP-grasp domain-containing protein [Patescibacteria group bacterium]|jgi:predicted ATP-grasp superfamily ATP-dependent carboligase
MSQPQALVLDGHLPSALACVRSLRSHDIKVTCGGERKTAMALHSRYADDSWVYPSPLIDVDAYVKAVVEKLTQMGDRPVIFCMSDNTLLPLLKNRLQVETIGRLLAPAESSWTVAFDKAQTLKLAERLNVPIPKTFFIESHQDLENVLKDISTTIIVKPRHSCVWVDGKGVRGKTEYAPDKMEAHKIVENIQVKTGEWPLLQERLTGEEFGIFGLWQDGEWKVKFAHRRLRSLDPKGGASCLRQSIDMPQEMSEYASKLMSELKWNGPAMVEFKLDKPAGEPRLMEINGRFWGSLALGIASGVDFPYLTYKIAIGEKVDSSENYRVPVSARSLLADGANLAHVIWNSKESGAAEAALKNFFFPNEQNLIYDVESWDDIKPSLWQVIDAVARKLS